MRREVAVLLMPVSYLSLSVVVLIQDVEGNLLGDSSQQAGWVQVSLEAEQPVNSPFSAWAVWWGPIAQPCCVHTQRYFTTNATVVDKLHILLFLVCCRSSLGWKHRLARSSLAGIWHRQRYTNSRCWHSLPRISLSSGIMQQTCFVSGLYQTHTQQRHFVSSTWGYNPQIRQHEAGLLLGQNATENYHKSLTVSLHSAKRNSSESHSYSIKASLFFGSQLCVMTTEKNKKEKQTAWRQRLRRNCFQRHF